MNASTSRTATGSLKPASPSSACASRRFSVEPRSTAKIAAPSVDATIDPTSMPSSVEKSKIHDAANPAITAVRNVPTSARLTAVPEHGADLGEAGAESALEQDQGQRDDADRAGQLVVVLVVAEVDPARPVGPDRHADAEEQDQGGNAQTARDEGGEKSGGQEGADNEKELAVRHGPP